MTVTDTLARDDGAWDINTGTAGSPVWTPIGGLNSWSPSPSKNDADTTKFSNNGWQSHLPASRGLEHTLSGLVQVDPSTGARDAGQAACEKLALEMGVDGISQFRHTMTGGTVNVFDGSCNVTRGGGGNDDPSAWECTVTMSGAPVTTLAADVPDVVTSVIGTGGDDFATVTWTNGAEAGTLFEVRVYNNASALVASIISSSKPVYVPLAAASGYTARVRAQNDAGWSDLSTASASFTVT